MIEQVVVCVNGLDALALQKNRASGGIVFTIEHGAAAGLAFQCVQALA